MKTNKLTYKKSTIFGKNGKTYKLNVTIKLGDECKNRHCDFSVTADLYENNQWSSGGCLHDTILEHFPEFEMFVKLHLCDYLGAPMFPVGDGMYHMQNSGKTTTMEYLRITEDEYNKLSLAADDKYFKYLLVSLGIIDRWKDESTKAIKELERLTGDEWVNPSSHSHFSFTEAERAEIERLIANGYYTTSNVKKRKEEEKIDRIKKRRTDIIEWFDRKKLNLETEKQIKLYILDNGIESNNYIYYPSRNEVVFNWLDLSEKIAQEEFIDFLQRVDYSKLPDGITFKIKQ